MFGRKGGHDYRALEKAAVVSKQGALIRLLALLQYRSAVPQAITDFPYPTEKTGLPRTSILGSIPNPG